MMQLLGHLLKYWIRTHNFSLHQGLALVFLMYFTALPDDLLLNHQMFTNQRITKHLDSMKIANSVCVCILKTTKVSFQDASLMTVFRLNRFLLL